MRVAIIPARGGSKRIAGKNVREFAGKPVIAYALDAADSSGLFDEIHVSTESDEIRGIVERLGFPVAFPRPAELADDHTGIIPVLRWVLTRYRQDGREFDDVCAIMPTAPLLRADDLRSGFHMYYNHDRKRPVHVVARFPAPVEWAYRRDDDGRLTPINPGAYRTRSQDLQPAYYETGPFSIFHVDHILGETPVEDQDFVSIILPPDRAVDIDDDDDWRLAETLFLGLERRSAVLSTRTRSQIT